MFQIQLHIIKLDFLWSEAEAHHRSNGGRSGPLVSPSLSLGGYEGLPPPGYGIYTQIRVPPNIWSCKPPHSVVTQLLIIVRSVCWLAPVVFFLRIGDVFHIKSCVSAVFWSCVLRRLSAVIHNSFTARSYSYLELYYVKVGKTKQLHPKNLWKCLHVKFAPAHMRTGVRAIVARLLGHGHCDT